MTAKRALFAGLLGDIFKIRNHILADLQGSSIDPEHADASAKQLVEWLIIFRFAEDHNFVKPASLHGRLVSWQRGGQQVPFMQFLEQLFRDFEEVYHAGLFTGHSSLDFPVRDDTLVRAVEVLCSHDFSQLPADFLGAVHEDYLGHVHSREGQLSAGVSSRLSTGSYYTPPAIVDFITRSVLDYAGGVSSRPLTIIDPACGAGVFLVSMFREWTSRDGHQLATPGGSAGFVQHSLFGVDIDRRATEITAISLLFSCFQQGHAIPQLLDRNIQTFNSLTIPLSPGKGTEGDSWSSRFPGVFDNRGSGGFDIVFGNPPWGASVEAYRLAVESGRFVTAVGQYDSFEVFIELGLELLKENGILGFVIPDSFFKPEYERIRQLLVERSAVLEILKLGEGFFDNVYRSAVIILVRKGVPSGDHLLKALNFSKNHKQQVLAGEKSLREIFDENSVSILQQRFRESINHVFDITAGEDDIRIREKLGTRSLVWRDLMTSARGVEFSQGGLVIQCPFCFKWDVPPLKRKGTYRRKTCSHCGNGYPFEGAAATETIVHPEPLEGTVEFFPGKSVNRYYISSIYHLDLTREGINYKSPDLYRGKKLLVRKTGIGLYAVISSDFQYFPQGVFCYRLKDLSEIASELRGHSLEYVLGILCSRLMLYYYYHQVGDLSWKSFPQITQNIIESLPVRRINFNDREERECHDKITELVVSILETGYTRERDLAIEEHVMKLYGITDDERKRVFNFLRYSVQHLRIVREVLFLE
ncbi:MAG: Eco57I restriction-modification methylase domain-containing protein [Candidatus Odinarchaeota archaeon]